MNTECLNRAKDVAVNSFNAYLFLKEKLYSYTMIDSIQDVL